MFSCTSFKQKYSEEIKLAKTALGNVNFIGDNFENNLLFHPRNTFFQKNTIEIISKSRKILGENIEVERIEETVFGLYNKDSDTYNDIKSLILTLSGESDSKVFVYFLYDKSKYKLYDVKLSRKQSVY